MYCKKSGNELREGDEFCSKCGYKISNVFQENPLPSTTWSRIFNTMKKFLIGSVCITLLPIWLYSISIPKNLSIIDFIEDPRGLATVMGQATGTATAIFMCFLPLLYGMKNFQITKRTYILEVFFILIVVFEIIFWLFDYQVIQIVTRYIALPMIGALITGLFMVIYGFFKKE